MSYGIWKKRGKDWSSFELDGCDSWKWDRMPEFRRRILNKKAIDAGIAGSFWVTRLDPAYVIWHLGQLDRGRTVEEVRTNSDHALWISYRNEAAKAAALRANGYLSTEGERVHATHQ